MGALRQLNRLHVAAQLAGSTGLRAHPLLPARRQLFGWGLYAWNATTVSYSWCSSQVNQTGTDSYGVYFDVPINPAAGSPVGQLGFIINNCNDGGIKDPGPNQYLQVTQYTEAWVISGDATVFTSQPTLAKSLAPVSLNCKHSGSIGPPSRFPPADTRLPLLTRLCIP